MLLGPDDIRDPQPESGSEGRAEGAEDEVPRPKPKPFTGGYYWLPRPTPAGVSWSVVTCRDLGCGRDAGHDADLWPRLMGVLAEAWGKDARVLNKKLDLCYTALPRGRVTRPEKTYLILHGNDSPTTGWEGLVIAGFRLSGVKVRILFDAHETQLPGHQDELISILGPLR